MAEKELLEIEVKHKGNRHQCKLSMFATVKRNDPALTYETVIKALIQVGKRQVAEAVCTNKGINKT